MRSQVPSPFFSVPGHLQCFILAGRGYCKTSEAQEVHFKVFQWACETRVSLEFFWLKLHYLLPIFSFMFH